jgi:Fanconi anemia group M protein
MKKKTKPVIVVDSRECSSDVLRNLKEFDVEITEKQLGVADYICSSRVCVERKSVSDFLQSITDQRLFKQLEALVSSYERPVLIIEGNPELLFLERNMHKNTIRGVLASIAIDYKIPIIWTANCKETAGQLFWIANREQVLEKNEIQIRANRKAATLAEQQEFLIAGLPGINSKRARKLLDKFKTPEKVFKASEKRLMQIDGFGEKITKRMKEVLKEEYE